MRILEKITPADMVVIDTISSLAATLRRNVRFSDLKATESVWKYKSIWDRKDFMTVYDMAEKMIMQRLKEIRNKGARVLVLCHEDKQTNERTLLESTGPELNPAFYKRLSEACSDMFRMSVTYADERNEEGKLIAKADSRILQLKSTLEVIAKYHVPLERAKTLPARIINPTLPKIYEKLGKKPSFMCVYGAPGLGKTTLALSEFIVTEKAK